MIKNSELANKMVLDLNGIGSSKAYGTADFAKNYQISLQGSRQG
jgi:hypothetical protein